MHCVHCDQPHNAFEDLLDFGVCLRGRAHTRAFSITNEGLQLPYVAYCGDPCVWRRVNASMPLPQLRSRVHATKVGGGSRCAPCHSRPQVKRRFDRSTPTRGHCRLWNETVSAAKRGVDTTHDSGVDVGSTVRRPCSGGGGRGFHAHISVCPAAVAVMKHLGKTCTIKTLPSSKSLCPSTLRYPLEGA